MEMTCRLPITGTHDIDTSNKIEMDDRELYSKQFDNLPMEITCNVPLPIKISKSIKSDRY